MVLNGEPSTGMLIACEGINDKNNSVMQKHLLIRKMQLKMQSVNWYSYFDR